VSTLPDDHPAHRLAGSAYLRACRRVPGSVVPVWFQRQAGRSLPEYRRLRGDGSILDAIAQPDLAAELTLQPVRRYGVDAAILFSDIMIPAHATGLGVEIVPGTGPVVDRPLRQASDLDRVRPLEADVDVPHVLETVRLVVKELDIPLIGFAGAPFTVASYLIEGGPSRHHGRTKALMLSEPDLWHGLCEQLAGWAVALLRAQVAAGASSIQLFDSWVGAVTPQQYATYVQPHTTAVFEGVADLGVPRAHFGVATGELLPLFVEAGATVVGIDWRVPLDRARQRLSSTVAVQGNLDPAVCLAPWPAVERESRRVLAANGGRPGHIFNLGHGVLPETDPGILERIVELVHSEGRVEGSTTP
jgi:uroporphyrinogen decarboxylase